MRGLTKRGLAGGLGMVAGAGLWSRLRPALAGPGHVRTRRVSLGLATLELKVMGEGPPVMLLPSLGRGPEDFAALADVLVRRGHRVLLPSPYGLGGSTSPQPRATLLELAEDLAHVLEIEAATEQTTVVGHAFGNRVARGLATLSAGRVDRVALLAAGGHTPVPPEVVRWIETCFALDEPDAVRLDAIGRAFFAPGNDPSVWRDGWYPQVAREQSAANRNTPLVDWWTAGSAQVLIVQPRQDVVAPPSNADRLQADLGDRAVRIDIEGAGHALLPERPREVAAALLGFLALGPVPSGSGI